MMETVRNGAPGLKGRAIAGAHDYDQIPRGRRARQAALRDFYADLDAHLADVPFVAGEQFSAADIALVTVDFATKAISLPIPEKHKPGAIDVCSSTIVQQGRLTAACSMT